MTAPQTHAHDGELVVFHIGMTIRKAHRPDLWLPVVRAMPRMLTELARNTEAAARGGGGGGGGGAGAARGPPRAGAPRGGGGGAKGG
ncbi:DUF4188 domain-containing protein, partial [uncultured Serinicoccus sp.]|uniref:monooxygenase family protein n=1 Tax=uncultured Serinicoccus sp. TaxID=735514 RepID=UPI00262C4A42